MELSEVEHHVERSLPGVHQVAVDVFKTEVAVNLVAYICFTDDERTTGTSGRGLGDIFLPLTPELHQSLSAMLGELAISLPRYMIPTILIPCSFMPYTITTKLDRRALLRLTENLSHEDLARYSLENREKRAPETPIEAKLRKLWSDILKIPVEAIGRDDSFLRIGGDSVAAIRLVSAARESGLHFTVQDIFNDPRLLALASTVAKVPSEIPDEVTQFELLEKADRVFITERDIQEQLALATNQSIQDAYPATKLQQGLMALAIKQPGSYIARHVYKLPSHVDKSRFMEAWSCTVEACTNLRTRIIRHNESALQILVDNDVDWEPTETQTIRSYMDRTRDIEMVYGSRLCRYALVADPSGDRYFVTIIHHAVFDGWSMGLILENLILAYRQAPLRSLRPYANFIKYTLDIDETAASNFWMEQLKNAHQATFPSTNSLSSTSVTRLMTTTIDFHRYTNRSITKATILRAAWSIILARYSDTDDVCFGTTVSGRNASVLQLEAMPGPTVATIPVRVRLNRQQSILQFLEDIQSQASAMVPFEQFGIQNIARLSPDAKSACDFTSLLVIQPSYSSGTAEQTPEDIVFTAAENDAFSCEEAMDGYFSYPLVIQPAIADKHIDLLLTYDSTILSEQQIVAVSRHFSHVVQQLLEQDNLPLKDVSVTGPWDVEQAFAWSKSDHPVLEACIHDLISERVVNSPGQPALVSTTCSLTYAELEHLSEVLADYLTLQGVRLETAVPFCLEKSIYAVVAMLGIMKAGGVFVPLDPSHPIARHQAIIREAGATLIIVSPKTAPSFTSIAEQTFELSPSRLSQMSRRYTSETQRVKPTPSNAAYILFTSGSTGTPKAIVVDHAALSSSIKGFGRVYHFDTSSRVLQFSSYVFDVSLSETLETLAFGGTICVPSDEERVEDLSRFITARRVNTAMLTSSFLRTLRPEEVPTLSTLILVGEPPTKDILGIWFGRVRIINAYGPSEGSIFCASHLYTSPDEVPTNIGQAFSGSCWIVEPDDYSRLAPIGCVGEILLQRHMARGYLNDEERTQGAFMKSVNFMPTSNNDTRTFHKTGDLGRYNADGTIEYLGRRDTQVKVRGFRIELGEVEYNIKSLITTAEHVVADVVRQDGREILAAFISFSDESLVADGSSKLNDLPNLLLQMSDSIRQELGTLIDDLKSILPGYMVPSLFFPLESMPFNTSLKVDRRRLRSLLKSMAAEELVAYKLATRDKVSPVTETEMKLRDLWAQLLDLDVETIGRNDSFLELGGDSITAIQLVALAQQAGCSLSVAMIFQSPQLYSLANAADNGTASKTLKAEPFSLLEANQSEIFLSSLQSQFQLDGKDEIEDAYPCTPLQSGLMALASKQPGSYIARNVYRIPKHIDLDRFRAAWKIALRICTNLRTRIVVIDGSHIQAVIKENITWEETDKSLNEFIGTTAQSYHIGYGSRLCHYAVLTETSGENYFVWMMHHAIFDGWSNGIVLSTLNSAYHGMELRSLEPYSGFIKYTMELDSVEASIFWKAQLKDAQKAAFPPTKRIVHPQESPCHTASRAIRKTIDLSGVSNKSITKASILRATWAILLARYCETRDVCFGSTVSGRNAAVTALAEMPGPMIATVPIRIVLDQNQRVSQFLQGIQSQASDMTAYEQFGLQHISKLSQEAQEACDFTSLLVVQHAQKAHNASFDYLILAPPSPKVSAEEDEAPASQFNYPLVLEGNVLDDQVELVITYHENVLSTSEIDALSHQFEHVARQIVTKQDISLGSISIAGPWDLNAVSGFNDKCVPTIEKRLHDMVSEQAHLSPTKEAIYSTKRSITYAELDHTTTQFAAYLSQLGVRPETRVPFCFEKSIWTIIAMISIMKAGGIFIPLDPSHPFNRRKGLIDDLEARFLIVSPSTASSCDGLVEDMVELSDALLSHLTSNLQMQSSSIAKSGPRNAAYILFTSGSTGKPKGIIIDHRGICTSLAGQGTRFCLSSQSRYLQFANYVFDASISEIFSTLLFGGTVCVPSDAERLQGTAEFITKSGVNTALLTPSFVRTLTPAQVPTLTTLIVGGETPAKDTLSVWQPYVTLINAYGPTEACIACAANLFQSPNDLPTIIGRNLAGLNWVIDLDTDRLTPVGCVGELVVQGDVLACGYLNDEEKTKESFISRLECLPPSAARHTQRFYKTGDLVKYRSDGALEYIGRKDSQLKLRGQRIELGEIEHAMKDVMPRIEHVAVEMLSANTGDVLLAFFTFNEKRVRTDELNPADFSNSLLNVDEALEEALVAVIEKLKTVLPSYMIPTFFLPLSCMPFVSSMKLDRKRLRSLATSLSSTDRLVSYSMASGHKVAPSTEMECKLRDIWARVLKLVPQAIGKNDQFFQIGGDSISAIHVVSMAQEQGISMTVSGIFKDSRLSSMAAAAGVADQAIFETEPFSLLPASDLEVIQAAIKTQCHLSEEEDVEDAYPCTSLQEGLIALAEKQPGSYIARHIYRIPEHVEVKRFKAAWEKTLELCGNLRTRIVQLPSGSSVQAVVRNDVMWESVNNLDLNSYFDEVANIKMTYGSRLCRYAMVQQPDGQNYFVWVLHHTVFDGWTVNLVLKTLYEVYQEQEVETLHKYASFIKYTESIDHDKACSFWAQQLHDAKKATFPRRPNSESRAASRGLKKRIVLTQPTGSAITKASVLHAAWAVLLSRYCDSDDVTFGTTVSGRNAPVPGVRNIPGPAIATVPVRLRIDPQKTAADLLRHAQDQASEMIAFEQFGIQKIAKLNDNARDACDFTSLLVIQPIQQMFGSGEGSTPKDQILVAGGNDVKLSSQDMNNYFSYPLVLQCFIMEDHTELHFTYDPSVLAELEIVAISHQLEHVVQSLLSKAEKQLSQLPMVSPWDLKQATERNSERPEIIDDCVHHLFEKQAEARPHAIALRAWDCEFTYRNLNRAANRLAHHLINNFSVQPDEFVQVCFDKSAWHVVAILAINKAGAAWVPLDPSHPVQRQRQIVSQTKAKLALTSVANASMCSGLVASVLEVSPALDEQLSHGLPQGSDERAPSVNITSHNAVYALFTSGSTGVPKGFVMEHGAVCTSQTDIGKRLKLTPDVKMLQFAAFVFDLSIGEIIAPLIHGACLCIPSEHIRMNSLTNFIRDLGINWAFLTPSFARTTKPEDVPSLKLLLFAGEAVGRDVFDNWFGKVRLVNGWGPAETCCFSTLHEWKSRSESSVTIGRPVGGFCWIVDPEDPKQLAPIGCLGEIVIQGPTVLREYLADPDRTKATVVTPLPAWAPRPSGHWDRFYKSGDVGFYNPDGTIEFSSRKDTQVKIRGLRVELGEVEYRVRNGLEGVQQVAVDMFNSVAGTNLICFFCMTNDSRPLQAGIEVFGSMTDALQSRLTALVGQLGISLPRYMIPTTFVPCKYMPFITSTKLDRNGLKASAAALSLEQLARYSLQGSERRQPETALEIRLQKIWSGILHIPVESIGRDDSFLRMGGDSVTAIQLVAVARENNIVLTVQDIFDDPRLLGVASKAVESSSTGPLEVAPFSLMGDGFSKDQLGENLCLSGDQFIEDAYPTTKLQEGLIALAVKQPGSYIAKYVYRLHDHIDTDRFKEAWARTISTCTNLRTRITLHNESTIQVIVGNDMTWDTVNGADLNTFMSQLKGLQKGYNSRLCRYALVTESNGERHFVLTIHHAVFDGWSMGIVLETLTTAYNALELPVLQPYSGFIKYIVGINQDAAMAFWRSQLEGATRVAFPPATKSPGASCIMETKIVFPRHDSSSITKATVVRAAWAIILAAYCNSNDVCFGSSISGRQAAVPGLETMPGPMVATIPVRVCLSGQSSVSQFLENIQSQALATVPFEQYGLQNISKISPEAMEACEFSSLLVIHPGSGSRISSRDSQEAVLLATGDDIYSREEAMDGYFSYPLVAQGILADSYVGLLFTYDPDVLSEQQMSAISRQFNHVAQQLLTDVERPMSDISVAGPWDLEQSMRRNSDAPEIVDACIHELVEKQAASRPNALAIRAWDVEFTYQQLDLAANRLANQLVAFGIQSDELVHVCFEKSAWFIVAILAINKAGGVWVPLDPSHPPHWHRQVVEQTRARLALVSEDNATHCATLVDTIIKVTPALDKVLLANKDSRYSPAITVSPCNAAYVLFTSGSTGTPKGLVMDHRAVCTSQTAAGKRIRLTPDVRVLQFAAYVFDMAIAEIICPLIHGACVCVPSEETRMNGLIQFIHDMDINWLFLTPAFARTLKPEQVPSVELLLLAGEAVGRDVFQTWFSKVRFINGWGPAETCVFSTLHEWTAVSDQSPRTIGTPVGGFCWIVDPEDPQRLAPIGTLGEIVIQGPTILREYLADPNRTKETTVTDLPSWAPNQHLPHWSRFYKSGDLGFYNADGTIQFSTRKDTQVKIRGLRIELGDVEYHIRAALDDVKQVAVDVFRTDAGVNLVAYFSFDGKMKTLDTDTVAEVFAPLSESFKTKITAIIGQLSVTLPQYMIPSLYIPCHYMPSITSTKLDRNGLKRLTALLNQEQLNEYSLQGTKKRVPETPMECSLQTLWSELLTIPPESIGLDDNFLRIGGDSIAAIQLVTKARACGISITVKDIFDDPRLSSVASKATEADVADSVPIVSRFTVLDKATRDVVLGSQFRLQSGYASVHGIEDAYPCTALQEGLMSLTAKQPGSYVAKYVYKLGDDIDVQRFKAAWKQVVITCANLRTRILEANGAFIQVLIEDDVAWEPLEELDVRGVVEIMKKLKMGYGTRLVRYSLATEPNGDRYFVWMMHHAIFDGWTLGLLFHTLTTAYYDTGVASLTPYAGFIKYTSDINPETAQSFWRAQLKNAKRASFPPVTRRGDEEDNIHRITTMTFQLPKSNNKEVTSATILLTAWAILLARHSESDDVCFGAVVSGRQAPVSGLETMAGATVATVPVRVRFDARLRATELLKSVQDNATQAIEFEQFGPQNIAKLGREEKAACDFSSLFVVQPNPGTASTEGTRKSVLLPAFEDKYGADEALEGYFNYPLVLQVNLINDYANLTFFYHANVLEESKVVGLSHQFNNVVQQLILDVEKPLGELSISGTWDMEQAMRWNEKRADIVSSCLHEMISARATSTPDQEAIYSSKGVMTYYDLDTLSSQLANYLAKQGVCPESKVPFCLEKSPLAIVAMLAIMKAGGVFIPLDPAQPAKRRQALVDEVNAQFIIASSSTAAICAGMAPHVIKLGASMVRHLSIATRILACPKVASHHAVYILFTSGSTGKPKGVVVEHSAICTSLLGQGKYFGLGSKTRYLQFANYVFDASISEIFSTLLFGGTVCVPSDDERLQHTVAFMKVARVNTALLTPSFVRTFTPDQVPTLETLIVGGEAPTKDTIKVWQHRVKLINAYGPTEVCIACAAHVFQSPEDSPTTIGRSLIGPNWVVEPDNFNRLTPIGCVGELVVQGHALARGYLNDAAKTAAAFINDMRWLPSTAVEHTRKFYRTGDLVKYNADGTLEYVGRQDSQLKLRGQRIELAEIEYAIKAIQPNVRHAVVDLVHHESGDGLVAFISYSGTKNARLETTDADNLSDAIINLDETWQSKIRELAENLLQTLPGYMVPSFFLPLRYMPYDSSMKLDRRKLRNLADGLSSKQLLSFSWGGAEKEEPVTDMEYKLRDLWGHVLATNPLDIGRHDSFLQIGGDSITAIQLVSLAEKQNIGLSVASIFKDSRLSHLATTAVIGMGSQTYEANPFDLLPNGTAQSLLASFSQRCSLASNQTIEDAYPCTSLQEGLMALAVRQPGSYIGKNVYRLPAHVDLARFKAAWELTVDLCANLRSHIVANGQQSYQVIVKSSEPPWEDSNGDDLPTFMKRFSKVKMHYGSPLTRYAIVKNNDGERYFVWVIHHAVFDGWSHGIILNTLFTAYAGGEVAPPQPYPGFIKYVMSLDHDAATDYWNSQLHDAKRATFPPSPAALKSGYVTRVFKKHIGFFEKTNSHITKATVLRAAWAVVLSRYSGSDDICFGATVSGRNAPVTRIEEMAGPAIATVPVRVKLEYNQPVLEFLRSIQNQASDMVRHEQYGVQNIAKLSLAAKEACEFTSLLVIQPVQQGGSVNTRSTEIPIDGTEVQEQYLQDSMQNYFTYPLVSDCFVHNDHVELQFTYQSDVLSEEQCNALAHQFQNVFRQLMQHDKLLGDITLAGSWDTEQAMDWNKDEHPVHRACIHDLIAEQVARSPEHEAIFSSYGSLTYSQLDDLSTKLAHHLSALGVRPETMVPMCFEKSMWAIVAMVGIMKAGGVYIPIDPSHPKARREALIKEASAQYLVVSPTTASSCASMAPNMIEVSTTFFKQLAQQAPLSKPSPRNAAYVLFTSGSTGKPKAIVVDHIALCTSIAGYERAYALDKASRVLQFSNYAFDVSLCEIFETLAFGGTICVPTDRERMEDIPGFVRKANANTLMLTSSFLRTLSPEQMPSVTRLLLVGEPPDKSILDTWVGRAEVVNAYGPSEASIFCASHVYTSADEPPTTIGRAFSGSCWIVEPDNHNQLAPIGCVGEILLQRHMARGYLNDEERTRRSFIQSVSWLPKDPGDTRKFHKTGDLARYNFDGTIEYLGRRDTQVKVRGYRIELGEIEYCIQRALNGVEHVAVDVLRHDTRETLAAFISFSDKSISEKRDKSSLLLQFNAPLQQSLSVLADELKAGLPAYMVPSMFIPLRSMPFNTSLKIDRQKLRSLADNLTPEQVAHFVLATQDKVPPSTDMEFKIREIWAIVLGIQPEDIGKNDTFLQSGGDSITAIRLASIAQAQGINLSVTQIFATPRLSTMAAASSGESGSMMYKAEPFELIQRAESLDVQSMFRIRCAIPSNGTIEDMYPCTSIQDFYLEMAINQPGSYTPKRVYKLPKYVDLPIFKAAWEKTVETLSLLRTRIINYHGTSIQAVVANDIHWEPVTPGTNLKTLLESMEDIRMGYDTRLSRYALVEDNGNRYFVWVIHHSVFDAWSTGMTLDTFYKAYHNLEMPTIEPFRGFIKYVATRSEEASRNWWISQLSGSKRCEFPRLPGSLSTRPKNVTRFMKRTVKFPETAENSNITKATVLRAAWAMMLGHHGQTDDVVFFETVSGRQAPISGLANVAGPVLARVPVRVQFNADQSASDLLQDIQTQASEMIAHEQYGMQKIVRLRNEIADACKFSSLIIVQPMQLLGSNGSFDESQALFVSESQEGEAAERSMEGYYNYPLVLHGLMSKKGLDLHFIYQLDVLSQDELSTICDELECLIGRLLSPQDAQVANISLSTE